MIIQAATFKAAEIVSDGYERGTVEIDFRGQIKTVQASKLGSRIIARGFGGRYQTGSKVWPATVTLDVNTGNEYADFGRDDRSGRFSKMNGIFLI